MLLQTLLLTLCGADLDLYTPEHWRFAAHEAAAYLTGSGIRPVRSALFCGAVRNLVITDGRCVYPIAKEHQ